MERLEEMAAAGRPVEARSTLDDETLWAAYRLARVTVFPSLNEGFGLPVGESIAAGTPAVTSDFGSMREIAEGGGALMVDPRDDHALADALRTVLTDDRAHAALAAACRTRSSPGLGRLRRRALAPGSRRRFQPRCQSPVDSQSPDDQPEPSSGRPGGRY